ncbi:MAG: radical SAM protein [Nitrososphaerota archaeon]|nr:radical SAM protein [Aigarchaeota archaeon]MDW8076430.1 radical SAM protein [Nitrososphaerota archaeon]
MPKIYVPHPKYPTVSITGSRCELKCDYCRGLVLRTMVQIESPDRLLLFCKRLKERGSIGCLISGGFNREGKLPFEPYIEAIRCVKRELDLTLSIHPGVVDKDDAIQLRDSGIDIIEFYLALSNSVLRNVMHTKLSKEDVLRALDIIYTYGPRYVSPHITVGSDYGKISWEYEAINALRDYDPYVLIFLILVPIEGTPMAHTRPPPINDLVSLFATAKKKLENTELVLGCMRVRGKYSQALESELIGKGLVDRIAVPYTSISEQVIEACCSLPNSIASKYAQK